MADKEYQTEGAMEMAASIKPMSGGYYLVTAEDILVPGDKSLADYIKGGGGGSGGSGDTPAVDYTTVWEIKKNPDITGLPTSRDKKINVNFTVTTTYTQQYVGIYCYTSGAILYDLGYTSSTVYTGSAWIDERYRTITIQEKITDARLYAWLTKNAVLLSGTAEPPVQYAYDELLETENKTVVGAINEINGNGGGSGGGATSTSSTMPTIRFVGLRGNNYLSNTDGEQQSVQFTTEIISGSVQVGDTLQMCAMRTFAESPKNKVKKRKLRRFAEYTITENDLNKRIFTLTIEPKNNSFAYLGHNNRRSGGVCLYYFRIRRPVGDLQNNDSGMTNDAEFSNVVAVTMLNVLTDTQEDDEGNVFKSLKINIV